MKIGQTGVPNQTYSANNAGRKLSPHPKQISGCAPHVHTALALVLSPAGFRGEVVPKSIIC